LLSLFVFLYVQVFVSACNQGYLNTSIHTCTPYKGNTSTHQIKEKKHIDGPELRHLEKKRKKERAENKAKKTQKNAKIKSHRLAIHADLWAADLFGSKIPRQPRENPLGEATIAYACMQHGRSDPGRDANQPRLPAVRHPVRCGGKGFDRTVA
jgi:hypothetical protein